MRLEKALDWLVGALVVAVLTWAALSMYRAHIKNQYCESNGGVLLKTYNGYECVAVKKVSRET